MTQAQRLHSIYSPSPPLHLARNAGPTASTLTVFGVTHSSGSPQVVEQLLLVSVGLRRLQVPYMTAQGLSCSPGPTKGAPHRWSGWGLCSLQDREQEKESRWSVGTVRVLPSLHFRGGGFSLFSSPTCFLPLPFSRPPSNPSFPPILRFSPPHDVILGPPSPVEKPAALDREQRGREGDHGKPLPDPGHSGPSASRAPSCSSPRARRMGESSQGPHCRSPHGSERDGDVSTLSRWQSPREDEGGISCSSPHQAPHFLAPPASGTACPLPPPASPSGSS
ncbi:uncharacterized protein LOC126953443 [Macaca thibetana thibetana]|uniref:uncharacterized protein LOC126953443 n=1 Tax=Macaca thibetana thibetana TaxID=257877 RepID=UPI0021BCCE63|nr:uncharacterized protein LOC126953443 [Macaca thibetana thibetana]